MSQSISSVRLVRPCSMAKLAAIVDLPSPGRVEVKATTGRSTFMRDRRTPVRAERTDSENSDWGCRCCSMGSCLASSPVSLGTATSSGAPSFSWTSSLERMTAFFCSRLMASMAPSSVPMSAASRMSCGLGGLAASSGGTAGSTTRAIGFWKSAVASVSFTLARKVW